MRTSIIFIFILTGLVISVKSHAFPEMVRHGYTSCIACHASPNGGGIVTPYGRAISQELLSTWRTGERESQFAYGTVNLPAWLNLGGDVRAVQTHIETPKIKVGKMIFMQVDLEAAVSLGKFQLVGTGGRLENPQDESAEFISRRHYLSYKPTQNLFFRAGKFFPAIGIHTPDHVIVTKRNVGWDQNQESYNLEAVWFNENFEVFIDGVFGRPDKKELDRETGASTRFAYNFMEKHKAGFTYYYGSNDRGKRQFFGPFAILGFSPELVLLTELDFQKFDSSIASVNDQWGAVTYNKLSYEFLRGFHGLVTYQRSHLEFGDSKQSKNYYGLGFQFFSRPHFEFQFEWQKRKDPAVATSMYDFAWVQFHFYL